MAGEPVEVLVLADSEGNIYALPRRLVERARVPDELKGALRGVGRQGRRPWQSMISPQPIAADPLVPPRMPRPRAPWTVGWFQVPGT